MVPVGRPFLDYVLSALADAGFTRACLVIGPEHGAVRDYYQHDSSLRALRSALRYRLEPLGTANAVLAAEEFAGADEFLVINSDNYYPVDVLQAVQRLGQPGTVLFEAAALWFSTATSRRIASAPLPLASSMQTDSWPTSSRSQPTDQLRRRQARQHELLALRARAFSPPVATSRFRRAENTNCRSR